MLFIRYLLLFHIGQHKYLYQYLYQFKAKPAKRVLNKIPIVETIQQKSRTSDNLNLVFPGNKDNQM